MRCPECDSHLALDIEEEEYCPACGWHYTSTEADEKLGEEEHAGSNDPDDPLGKLPQLCCHCVSVVNVITGKRVDMVGMVLHFEDEENDFVAYELMLSQN